MMWGMPPGPDDVFPQRGRAVRRIIIVKVYYNYGSQRTRILMHYPQVRVHAVKLGGHETLETSGNVSVRVLASATPSATVSPLTIGTGEEFVRHHLESRLVTEKEQCKKEFINQ